MYCSKCGSKNEDTSKFCINCGEKLEITTAIDGNINNEKKLSKTNLSIASLVCLVISFIATPAGYFLQIKRLYEVPWFFISLILAIISRVKYKDKMSKVLIVIHVSLFALAVIAIVCIFIFAFLIIKNIDA